MNCTHRATGITTPMLPTRKEELRVISGAISVFLKAFPDRKLTIEDQLAEGDKVATRITMQATHTGNLPGIPATGRAVRIESMHICRLSNGRIAEEWEIFDALGMLRQLGVYTPPGRAVD